MIPGPFEYHRPHTKDEAFSLLEKYGDEGRILAGGHSLIPMMKLRMAVPENIIDIQSIADLKGISISSNTIEIGALTTQHEIIHSKELEAACPILKEAALLIADPQIRYCGTVGGNVANGDPGNDMPALMQCLNAKFIVENASGEREIFAREFYHSAYFTALEEGEIVTKISIPTPASSSGYAYEKMKRKVGDYATAASAVLLTMNGSQCSSASIALTNVGDIPLYAEEASSILVGAPLGNRGSDAAAIINKAIGSLEAICEPAADARGSAEYRTKMAGQMTRQAINSALSRAQS